MIVGGIEAGGTKFACALLEVKSAEFDRPEIISRCTIRTTTPPVTLAAAKDFFRMETTERGQQMDCLGIGCFGPVDVHLSSPTWGHVTSTPKPGWSGTDVAGYFRDQLNVTVAFDTDVNAAAYGEFLWGEGRGLKDFIYLTVGTGIGGGVFSGGSLVHGMTHPELGHVKVAREESDDFPGSCPYHRDCIEGMASGPALALRWSCPPESLPADHQAWGIEARYLARAIAAYALVLSPERVLMGGGVGLRPGLAERVSAMVGEELAGYVQPLADPARIADFVRRPALGADAGLYGSAALALRFCMD
ncbi:MAG TPA: ROK family protein [Rectinemataceae bacterium]|nr:ROK family protein [Rectinemataceae bacterium]